MIQSKVILIFKSRNTQMEERDSQFTRPSTNLRRSEHYSQPGTATSLHNSLVSNPQTPPEIQNAASQPLIRRSSRLAMRNSQGSQGFIQHNVPSQSSKKEESSSSSNQLPGQPAIALNNWGTYRSQNSEEEVQAEIQLRIDSNQRLLSDFGFSAQSNSKFTNQSMPFQKKKEGSEHNHEDLLNFDYHLEYKQERNDDKAHNSNGQPFMQSVKKSSSKGSNVFQTDRIQPFASQVKKSESKLTGSSRMIQSQPLVHSLNSSSQLSGSSKMNSSEWVNRSSQPNREGLSQAIQNQNSQKSKASQSENFLSNVPEQDSLHRLNRYSVTVTECDDESIDNVFKNNDIYGVESNNDVDAINLPKVNEQNDINCGGGEEDLQRIKEEEVKGRRYSQRFSSRSRDSERRALLGGYYDARRGPVQSQPNQQVIKSSSNDNFVRQPNPSQKKIQTQNNRSSSFGPSSEAKRADSRQVIPLPPSQRKQQPQNRSETKSIEERLERKESGKKEGQNQQSHNSTSALQKIVDSKKKQQYQRQKVAEICSSLLQILSSSQQVRDLYYYFQKAVSEHINLTFLEPRDRIGERLLFNGSNAPILIECLTITQSNPRLKLLYQEYLFQRFSDKILQDREEFKIYQQHLKNKRKEQILNAVQPIEVVQPPQQTQLLFPAQPVQDVQNNRRQSQQEEREERYDAYSLEVHENSQVEDRSIADSNVESSVKISRTEGPVKRKIHFQESSQVKPEEGRSRVGKKTKNRRGRSKATNASKNQKKTKRKPETEIKQNKKKVEEKRNVLKEARAEEENEAFGSAFTFEETKDGEKMSLRQVRVSLRINERKHRNTEAPTDRGYTRIRQRVIKAQQTQNELQPPGSVQKDRLKSPKGKQTRRKQRMSIRRTNQKVDEDDQLLNWSYIKKHFKELDFDTQQLQQQYIPLSEQDKRIQAMIQRYRELQHQEREFDHQQQQENSHNSENYDNVNEDVGLDEPEVTLTCPRPVLSQEQIKEEKEELRKELNRYENGPIQIERVVDPNVNNHNIYALLQLTRRSAQFFGARYVVMFISFFDTVRRNLVTQDLQTIEELVGEEERGNVGRIGSDTKILGMIEEEEKRRRRRRRQE